MRDQRDGEPLPMCNGEKWLVHPIFSLRPPANATERWRGWAWPLRVHRLCAACLSERSFAVDCSIALLFFLFRSNLDESCAKLKWRKIALRQNAACHASCWFAWYWRADLFFLPLIKLKLNNKTSNAMFYIASPRATVPPSFLHIKIFSPKNQILLLRAIMVITK